MAARRVLSLAALALAARADDVVLALPPSADGPYQKTRHLLYQASVDRPERRSTIAEPDELKRMRVVGSVVASAGGEWPRTAAFAGATRTFSSDLAPSLTLHELPFEGAGVGHQVWASAVVLAIYLRSHAGPALLRRADGGAPRVLELGAGLGLPGLDLVLRGAAASVTLTDFREPILAALREAAARLAAEGDAAEGGAAACAAGDGAWATLKAVGSTLARALQLALGWQDASAADAADDMVGPRPPCDVAELDWNDEAAVAALAATRPDVVIATDVVYRDEDVPNLTRCLRAMRAPLALIAAPRSRAAVDTLVDALGCASEGQRDGGAASRPWCTLEERAFTLVDTDWAAGEDRAGHAADYRVLLVRLAS